MTILRRCYSRFSLTEVTNTYVLFGLLMAAALLGADVTLGITNPLWYRATYLLWAAAALALPAVLLYMLPEESTGRENHWQLFWTFAFIAFTTHFCFATFGLGKTPWVALLLLVWWAFDLWLRWCREWEPTWVGLERGPLNLCLVAYLACMTLGYDQEPARIIAIVLGAGLIAVVLIGIYARILACVNSQSSELTMSHKRWQA